MQVVDSTTAVAKILGLRSKSDFCKKSDFFNTIVLDGVCNPVRNVTSLPNEVCNPAQNPDGLIEQWGNCIF